MLKIQISAQYKKDFKKLSPVDKSLVNDVVSCLAEGKKLDKRYRDHKLSGNLTGMRDCHIKPDLILIYSINNDTLILNLIRVGNHNNLQLSSLIRSNINNKLIEARQHSAVKSNGVYSVLHNRWIKEPVQTDIPDLNQKTFEKLFKEWEDKYFDLLSEIDSENILEKENIIKEDGIKLKEYLKKEELDTNLINSSTPYMLRNDGELIECGSIHPYILMSVKSSLETNIKTLNNHINFLDWFYDNTLQERVKNLITEYRETKDNTLLGELNELTNNEFCRVRTSNYKVAYGGDNGQIYFRISSNNGFNWFDLIYNVVLQYDNLDFVTILKDEQAFKDVKDFDYYKVKGKDVNQMLVEEFLTLEGNPILENLYLDSEI
jgi:mRNA interferase YafQ